MLTRYNFGAARDPEMLHKIYNAEPVAPIIENSRRGSVRHLEIRISVYNVAKSYANGSYLNLYITIKQLYERLSFPQPRLSIQLMVKNRIGNAKIKPDRNSHFLLLFFLPERYEPSVCI